MFKGVSVADFEVDGHKAQLMIDNGMPVAGLQAVLNKLMHFCVEKIKEAEDEETQRLKDEEAAKPPELKKASKEKKDAKVKEDQPVEISG